MKYNLFRKLLLACFVCMNFFGFSQSWSLDWVKHIESTSSVNNPSGGIWVNATEHNGEIYLSGLFLGTVDFDPGPTVNNLTSTIEGNLYIAKYDSLGNLIWVKNMIGGALGVNSARDPNSISISKDGDIYISGRYQGFIDFDPDTSNSEILNSGGMSSFVAKYDKFGQFLWVKQFSSSYQVSLGHTVSQVHTVIDNSENVYLTGHFAGTADFDPDTTSLIISSISSSDFFITKLDSNGQLLFVKTLGGAQGACRPSTIEIDHLNEINIGGSFAGTVDFDADTATYNMTSNGSSDGFLLKLDASGNFIRSNKIGGSNLDYISAITVDGNNNLLVTGNFESDTVDLDFSLAVNNVTSKKSGDENTFVLKLDANASFIWGENISFGNNHFRIYDIALGPNNGMFLEGDFFDSLIFTNNLNLPSKVLTSSGSRDGIFVNLDSLGIVQWTYTVNDVNYDTSEELILFPDNSIVAVGSFGGSIDCDPDTAAIYPLNATGFRDLYLSKLSIPNTVTSLDELEKESPFIIYPNPTSGNFSIKFQTKQVNTSLIIRNIYGQIVLNETIRSTSVAQFYLEQSVGVYLFQLIDDKGIDSSGKLILR